MLIDKPRLRRRLRGGRRGRAPDGPALQQIAAAIDASAARRQQRAETRPTPRYDSDLPVVARRSDIAAAIREHQVIVVCGETGSGKSTQLPKICLDLGRGVGGMIGHTQPRRIAARSIAARVAEELGTSVGAAVGYKVRFGDQVGPDTFIKVMTDGMLLAETQSDRDLLAYDTIIIDEAHERGLNIDFLLGYLKRLLPRRRDLKVIITSATIDPQRFSEHFDGAPILEVSGRTYPVEVRYRPLQTDDPDEQDLDVPQAVAAAVDELSHEGPGDMLIFMPGEREIRETAETLRKRHAKGTEILPLYARLSTAEQNRVFQPHRGRRIVIATNVAETSLTVPGVHYVIDPGTARISRYSARSGVQRLPVEPISQASADQRAGRCGRVSEGICIRLYSQADYEQRERFTQPEILRTNLASVILQMKALRLGDVERFPFLEPPRSRMIRDGEATLRELRAMDRQGKLTEVGERLARLPIDPRLGRMILQASDEGALNEVLIITSALAVQDPRDRPADRAEQADAAHRPWRDERSDFLWYINAWKAIHEKKDELGSSRFRKWCREQFLSYVRLREWFDTHRQLRQLAKQAQLSFNDGGATYNAVHRSLLAGLLSNTGKRTDGYAFGAPGGRQFWVFPGSALFDDPPRWIMAFELVETTRLYGRDVARIHPQWIEDLGGHLVERTHKEPHFDERSAQPMALQTVKLDGLELATNRRVPYGPIEPSVARQIFIRTGLVGGAYDSPAPFQAHNRERVTQIRRLEDKLRRRDLLTDADLRYAFYDAVIPPDVYSGRQFEKWRRRAEQRDPQVLYMRDRDVLRTERVPFLGGGFPESLRVGDVDLPLRYRFAPGHPEDGVTVDVPVEMLSRLDERQLDWLVPGYRLDKAAALIKTLPKSIRKHFVPVAEFAEAALEDVEPGEAWMTEALGRRLREMSGVDVPPDAWQPQRLPDHLRMMINVVDHEGGTLARGRSLPALRNELAETLAAPIHTPETQRYERRDITNWTFGDLPETVTLRRGAAASVTAHPALVDADGEVRLQLFDHPLRARVEMYRGLRRLLAIRLDAEARRAVDRLPQIDELRLRYASFGNPAQAADDLLLLAVEAACGVHIEDAVRTREAFEERLEAGRAQMARELPAVADLLAEVLHVHHEVFVALSEPGPEVWDAALEDMRRQVDDLVTPAVARRAPLARLRDYPRYLGAIAERRERLRHGGHVRDAKAMAELAPLLEEHEQVRQRLATLGLDDPAVDQARWLIEELRINRFAPKHQRERVSEKQVRAALDALRGL